MTPELWVLAELATNAAIVVCALIYLHRKLGTRSPAWVRMVAGGSVLLALLVICQYLALPDTIRMPLLAMASMAYALLAAGGAPGHRIFQAVVVFLMAGFSDAIVLSTLTFLPGVSFGMLISQTPYRLLSMLASKLLLLALVIVFSPRRREPPGMDALYGVLAAVPLISMAMLTVMVRYESLLNGQSSYGLLALAVGLFAMNVMLLALHGRLSARAAELIEKQRMLEQSELQNRHYQEALAADDSMRGFRHDMKNHLQVLGGFLEMGKADRAGQYLVEIGAFVQGNDLAINSGLPLVDAVLGGKLALARKQGIEVTHMIRLDCDAGMEPLDLCSILGNTLDNALEACSRMGEAPGRFIHIDLTCIGDAVNLSVRNSTHPATGPVLKSSKEGPGHGIGLSIVRKAVQKYRGTVDIHTEGAEFAVMIRIPAARPGPA